MQKEIVKSSKKKLELKKTAIAHLSLSEAQMKALVGGGDEVLTHTSKKIGDGDNTCTSTVTELIFTR
jgi:hypothetical protein